MRPKYRAPPLVYNPEEHREFVTGFRKRKEARRQEALAAAVELEKQARRDDRQQRRDFMKSNRKMVLGEDSEDEEEVQQAGGEVTTFDGEGGSVVTAVVAPMEMGKINMDSGKGKRTSEEDEEKNDKKDEKDDGKKVGGTGRIGAAKAVKKRGRRRVSYTHALAKGKKRKVQLRKRRADRAAKIA